MIAEKVTIHSFIDRPFIAHAVVDLEALISILQCHSILRPHNLINLNINFFKKSGYLEAPLGIDNVVFFSIGLYYNHVKQWPYGLIYSGKMVADPQLNFKLATTNLVRYAHLRILELLGEKNCPILEKIVRQKTALANFILKALRYQKLENFHQFEDQLYNLYLKTPFRRQLIQTLGKIKRNFIISDPQKVQDSIQYKFSGKANANLEPELFCENDIPIININFLGLYVKRNHLDEFIPCFNAYYKSLPLEEKNFFQAKLLCTDLKVLNIKDIIS